MVHNDQSRSPTIPVAALKKLSSSRITCGGATIPTTAWSPWCRQRRCSPGAAAVRALKHRSLVGYLRRDIAAENLLDVGSLGFDCGLRAKQRQWRLTSEW